MQIGERRRTAGKDDESCTRGQATAEKSDEPLAESRWQKKDEAREGACITGGGSADCRREHGAERALERSR